VTVVASTHIVHPQVEDGENAPACARQGNALVNWMYAVVDDERLAWNSRAWDALNGLIEGAGDQDRAPQSIFLEPNRPLFDA